MAPGLDLSDSRPLETTNRPDEWKIEQGLHGAKIPFLDQTGDVTVEILPREEPTPWKEGGSADVVQNKDEEFKQEREGWKGYVEWEAFPEKKVKAHKILERLPTRNPEYQMGPIPETNPVLEGTNFKKWHHAIAGGLKDEPESSWNTVLKEKHPEMLHLLQFPYNGEPPKRLTTAKAVTPNNLHFVRNHGGIPLIDEEKFSFDVDGLVNNPQKFTMKDIMDESRFPRVKKMIKMQCSGTRRIEQISLYAGQGDEVPQAPWAEGAIGNAEYVGISLKKLIKACGGLKDGAKHLEFYGADTYFKNNEAMNYVVSVPWSKVKANEVLLCWKMNGERLPAIHGFPLRVMVLGYIGARGVKWLYRVKAIENPSEAPVQSKEYLYFNQQVGKHNQVPTDGIQIQEMPVSSAIMSPWQTQAVIHNGSIHCKGWAYSGGGRWPERVELSADGGFSWYPVPLENMSKKHKFAWRIWEIDLPCDVEGWIEIVCRTWDNSLNTQPLNVRAAWNWGLHVTSSAHRVKVYSINKTKPATAKKLALFKKTGSPLAPITWPEEFTTQTMYEYKSFWEKHDPRDVDD
ncbi:hypothetical protein PRZ48_014564 [Zasmidium cellare]|uniref:Sulfite oxidase n=1 Tax=Zasmidium cellare TaxID=395010 RepID=A0ABR0DYL1_ZASCE|nr:hypothetical protein PRZ48_014564 [Zasmidium cellare]